MPQTLHEWVRRHEVDTGLRGGVSSEELDRIRTLEREVKELRKANEILKLTSAFFARAERPNQLWVSDFTYVSTWQSWCM